MRRHFNLDNPIKDLVVIETDAFLDFRGQNAEGFNQELYSEVPQIKGLDFKVDSFSWSKQGVLRGFHGDTENWKMIQCLYGVIHFKALDLRKDSPTYGKIFERNLSANNPTQILLPAGIVNAHQCLSEECLFFYKLSKGYTSQADQLSVKWNDPTYNFRWPIPTPILSERDK
jgi:dTDP-4-dehydrorhamnose 3,5-epimerase